MSQERHQTEIVLKSPLIQWMRDKAWMTKLESKDFQNVWTGSYRRLHSRAWRTWADKQSFCYRNNCWLAFEANSLIANCNEPSLIATLSRTCNKLSDRHFCLAGQILSTWISYFRWQVLIDISVNFLFWILSKLSKQRHHYRTINNRFVQSPVLF